MYCKVIIYHSSHYMAWCTRSTTPIYRRNTRKHTQGFTMGKTGSLAHCTYSEWNTPQSFPGCWPSLFSWILFHFQPLYFLRCDISSFLVSFSTLLRHPSAPSSRPSPPEFHNSQKIFNLPFFVLPVILFFYKHNMYRNSTQTNMFLNYVFFISKYNSFLWVLNSPHKPATHIHNEYFLCGFIFFVFFVCSLIIQIIRLRCKFWRFSHTKRTQFEQGASGLACTPRVQGPLTCLHVYLWTSCGAPACFRFTCRTECVLNGIYTSRSGATPPARFLLWYLHWNKDGGRGVWGQGVKGLG